MPNFKDIEIESRRFRSLLDSCDKSVTEMVTEDFPVMNCRLSSMLLSYHFLKIWPKAKITGVGGVCKDRNGEDSISHFWLELDNLCVDITSDQYNILNDNLLNDEIIKQRPFNPVFIGVKGYSFLYKIFSVSYTEEYLEGFLDIEEDFLKNMELSYAQLLEQETYTQPAQAE